MLSLNWRRAVAVTLLSNFLIASPVLGQPLFRLGVSGRPVEGGFEIESLVPDSPLLALRDSDGRILRAEQGDRIHTLNGKPFSPDLLQASQAELIDANGLVELEVLDSRTGNTLAVSAVLRRTDVEDGLAKELLEAAREEFRDVKVNEVRIDETDDKVIGVNVGDLFLTSSDEGVDWPLMTIAASLAGVDHMKSAAKEQRFEPMLPQGTYARAERIVANALAEASLHPDGDRAKAIADHAQTAVANEFRTSFEEYSKRRGKDWLEERRTWWTSGFFTFDPVTDPEMMIVEVIPTADVKLVLLRDKSTTPNQINQLTRWTPLPMSNATLYGRYYYRVKDRSGTQLFGYDPAKLVVVLSKPLDGKVLFP